MPVGRITKRTVDAITKPVGPARAYLWDDQLKGFGVMVTPNDARSYIVQYQLGGRGFPTKRYTIGRHGAPWTAERARERAADLLEIVRRGVDPGDVERQRREEAAAGRANAERLAFDAYVDTFGTRYLDQGGRRGRGKGNALRSANDVKAVLRREWVPVFRSRPLSNIRRQEIVDRLDVIADRSMSAAIKAHKWLRKLFAWAVERGDIGASPVADLAPPGADGERERWLTGSEVRTVWAASDKLTGPYPAFVKALFLTGQRLREVAGMDWSEVDLAKAEWIIPAARTKNKRDHLVPLAGAMLELLRGRFDGDQQPGEGPVFTTTGTKPINGFSKPKAALDAAVAKILAESGGDELPLMQPWVFHDARRTFSTGCQALGFSRDLIHEAVNQKVGGKRSGLASRYQLYEYQDEKTALMAAWARRVTSAVADTSNNVVSLAVTRA